MTTATVSGVPITHRMMLRLEELRLKLHFMRVLWLLEHAPLPAMTSPIRRSRTLAQLREYAGAGQFPLYSGSNTRSPVFVDHRGTHCAVGHLLEINGRNEVVNLVRRHGNFLRVHELVAVPGMRDSLEELGITPDEAALIQPSYSHTPIPPIPTEALYHGGQLTLTGIVLMAAGAALTLIFLVAAILGPNAWRMIARNKLGYRVLIAATIVLVITSAVSIIISDLK